MDPTPSPFALALALRAAHAPHLHVLPFDRFRPDDGVVWLSPGARRPAFAHPKLALIPVEDDLYAGFWVEKGYEGGADEGLAPLMTPAWAWHAFREDAARGAFDAAARDAVAAAGRPLSVHVRVASGGARETLWFRADPELRHERTFGAPGDATERLGGATDFAGLAAALDALPHRERRRAELFVGVALPAATGADEVWRVALHPWADRLRS